MLTVVTGPPCAGKSAHLARHATPGAIRIDLDTLAVALGSPDTHDHPAAVAAVARAARHAAIGEAIRQHHRGAEVWVIDSAPTSRRRRQYDDAGARWVRLHADRAELHRRATAAGRSPGTHRRIDVWQTGTDLPSATSRMW